MECQIFSLIFRGFPQVPPDLHLYRVLSNPARNNRYITHQCNIWLLYDQGSSCFNLQVTHPHCASHYIFIKHTVMQLHRRKFEMVACFGLPYGPSWDHAPFRVNHLNAELNPICYLLALLGAHHFFHVSRTRVKSLTLRLLMSYIYIWSTHSWCF